MLQHCFFSFFVQREPDMETFLMRQLWFVLRAFGARLMQRVAERARRRTIQRDGILSSLSSSTVAATPTPAVSPFAACLIDRSRSVSTTYSFAYSTASSLVGISPNITPSEPLHSPNVSRLQFFKAGAIFNLFCSLTATL